MKARLVLLAIITPIALVVAGVQAGYTWMFGTGSVMFLAGDSDVTIVIDGDQRVEVPAGSGRSVELSQGDHTIDYRTGSGSLASLSVGIGGFSDLVVAPPGSCVAEIDVTDAVYALVGDPDGAYRVQDVHGDGEFVDRPELAGPTVASLPSQIERGDKAYVMAAVPCSLRPGDDDDAHFVQALMR